MAQSSRRFLRFMLLFSRVAIPSGSLVSVVSAAVFPVMGQNMGQEPPKHRTETTDAFLLSYRNGKLIQLVRRDILTVRPFHRTSGNTDSFEKNFTRQLSVPGTCEIWINVEHPAFVSIECNEQYEVFKRCNRNGFDFFPYFYLQFFRLKSMISLVIVADICMKKSNNRMERYFLFCSSLYSFTISCSSS